MEAQSSDVLWIVIVGFIFAFILAFGIGANDVANSFGTSVGAKVLTLRQACIVAAIFELGGSILIGSKVSDTVRKGIININMFAGNEKHAMIGALSALCGTSIWLIVATFFKLPVSGSHSVVGATIGYALVASGAKGINWKKFGMIAASWVISPLLSGAISSILFLLIRRFILQKGNPFKHGLRALPVFYGFTLAINLFSVFYDSSDNLGIGHLNLYTVIGISVGSGFVVFLVVHFLISPWLKKRIDSDNPVKIIIDEDEENNMAQTTFSAEEELPPLPPESAELPRSESAESPLSESSEPMPNGLCVTETVSNGTLHIPKPNVVALRAIEPDEITIASTVPTTPVMGRRTDELQLVNISSESLSEDRSEMELRRKEEKEQERLLARNKIVDDPKIAKLFKFLQILTASFGSFAHGGNDVSNAIGPVISIWIIYRTGLVHSKASTPIWILVYGGVGIVIGLFAWGRRVIETIGEKLTPVTPTSGFSIEIGSALTVLIASNLGIPVSTTHCKVGSVVFTGRVRSRDVVDWSLFGNIVISWIVTMPITGAISAGVYAAITKAL